MKGHLHFDITEVDENTSRLTTDCHLEEVGSDDAGRLVLEFMKVLKMDPVDLFAHACTATAMENELFCDQPAEDPTETPDPTTNNHDTN